LCCERWLKGMVLALCWLKRKVEILPRWLKYRFVVLWRMVDGDGSIIMRDS
jgi:hypothetical protein